MKKTFLASSVTWSAVSRLTASARSLFRCRNISRCLSHSAVMPTTSCFTASPRAFFEARLAVRAAAEPVPRSP